MLITKLKVFFSHGRQYIPDLTAVELPDTFRGRPLLSGTPSVALLEQLVGRCPVGAISASPFTLDLGRCVFCNECAMQAPQHIRFTSDYRLATNLRETLVVQTDADEPIVLDPNQVRAEITRLFGRALRLRQVSAGGDNATEMELNATMNVNFDFGRYGIEFVASPRHADGVVITGPITENMAAPLELCYNAIPKPKIVILCGCDAISGGLFAGSAALNRTFLDRFPVDLYVPGNPVHPLTFIHGVLHLTGRFPVAQK